METKQDKVCELVRKAVFRAMADQALSEPGKAPIINSLVHSISTEAAYIVAHDKYNWLHLCDIMGWKNRTTVGMPE